MASTKALAALFSLLALAARAAADDNAVERGRKALICHGGSIAGHSYVGLGNASLDFQAFTEELAAASGRPKRTPFPFSHVRGTSEAGSFAVYLLSLRQPDLGLRLAPLDLEVRDHL